MVDREPKPAAEAKAKTEATKGGTAESMSVAHIHVQASVAPTAKLGSGVQIGPYAVVGDDVELGDGCILHSHAVVTGPSKIGRNNVFHPFSSIGGDPQDLGFHGEHVELIVGDGNTFREARDGQSRHGQRRRQDGDRQQQLCSSRRRMLATIPLSATAICS